MLSGEVVRNTGMGPGPDPDRDPDPDPDPDAETLTFGYALSGVARNAPFMALLPTMLQPTSSQLAPSTPPTATASPTPGVAA